MLNDKMKQLQELVPEAAENHWFPKKI